MLNTVEYLLIFIKRVGYRLVISLLLLLFINEKSFGRKATREFCPSVATANREPFK